jgi:predicted Zn-dependent peptidase
VPVDYYKLPNGLKVVLSRDTTTPTTCVAVYYNIGFRNEPRDRTGFAHLFEHMMFQGSQNLGKMEFIRLVESNGGLLNGSTRFDFTNYYQVVPSNVLETILWAEADRMRGLQITQDNLKNQQEVVKNEVKVNVLNQPYGGFPWIDLPMAANTNWFNAHNFYGDFEHLDAATLADVSAFFKMFYAPNNAVVVVSGDFEPASAKAWIEKYFAAIPKSKMPPPPDLTEPRQEKEKARGTHRPAREPARPRPRLSRSRAQHARVVRVRSARSAARAGPGLAAVRRARAQTCADRRRRCWHQLGPRQHVRLQRPDALDRADLPRLGYLHRTGAGGL